MEMEWLRVICAWEQAYMMMDIYLKKVVNQWMMDCVEPVGVQAL